MSCPRIISSGPYKGKKCGAKIKKGGFCGKHQARKSPAPATRKPSVQNYTVIRGGFQELQAIESNPFLAFEKRDYSIQKNETNPDIFQNYVEKIPVDKNYYIIDENSPTPFEKIAVKDVTRYSLKRPSKDVFEDLKLSPGFPETVVND